MLKILKCEYFLVFFHVCQFIDLPGKDCRMNFDLVVLLGGTVKHKLSPRTVLFSQLVCYGTLRIYWNIDPH